MRNIKLTFEYDGTHFWGYQRQKAGRTVQGELERVLSTITNNSVTLYCAGRTDSGVHAAGQVANFKTLCKLDNATLYRGVNSLLPSDIAVIAVEDVPEDFHARFSALSRRYVYSIHNSSRRTVFNRLYALHIPRQLDIDSMNQACSHLLGEQDFSSFRAVGDVSRHSIRRMVEAKVTVQGEVVELIFEANAFLQHMIRIIVGTLLIVGRGNMTVPEFHEVVQARDRTRAGSTASPHGLCLTDIRYPDV